MPVLSVGTRVKERKKVHHINKTGRIVKVKLAAWGEYVYLVKYPGDSKHYEYHKGELKKT